MIRLARSWYSLAGLLLFLVGRPTYALAQRATFTPTQCRRFVAELSNPVNDSTWHSALASIYDCPDELGPSLAALWRALPPDSGKRELLYWASAHVHDDSLYRQLVYQTLNTQSPDSLRFRALEALVTIADPALLITVHRLPGFSDTLVTVGVGGFSHPFVKRGCNPLPTHVRDSILALLQDLATTDSSSLVRRVAKRARDWLTYPR